MRKIELAPGHQIHLEFMLKLKIKECNDGIKKCLAVGDEKGAAYIRDVKRKPVIKKLRDVQNGFIWE